ncbi:hypothetical protein PTKIN_Ptkin10aG0061600 [Pterospermum kingtungense]
MVKEFARPVSRFLMTLNFFPLENGEEIAEPPLVVIEDREDRYQLVGKLPNFSYFCKMISLLWDVERADGIKPVGENMFLVNFSDEKAKDRILESGPWHIQNRPLIIRKWEPGLKSLEFSLHSIPIWVYLWNVPLELFSEQGLSYIVNVLGIPLHMDTFTAKQERLAFAKVCVAMNANKKIPSEIAVKLRGSIVKVRVEVPWTPPRYSACVLFGHSEKNHNKQLKIVNVRNGVQQQWIPKKQVSLGVEKGSKEVILEPSEEKRSMVAKLMASIKEQVSKDLQSLQTGKNKVVVVQKDSSEVVNSIAESVNIERKKASVDTVVKGKNIDLGIHDKSNSLRKESVQTDGNKDLNPDCDDDSEGIDEFGGSDLTTRIF